jgi:hypothetical protein
MPSRRQFVIPRSSGRYFFNPLATSPVFHHLLRTVVLPWAARRALSASATWSIDEAKVATGDADDGADHFSVGVDVAVGWAELLPVLREYGGDVFGVEWFVLVGEADPAVELRVAGQLPVEAGTPIRIRPRSKRSNQSRSCSRPLVLSRSASSMMSSSVRQRSLGTRPCCERVARRSMTPAVRSEHAAYPGLA